MQYLIQIKEGEEEQVRKLGAQNMDDFHLRGTPDYNTWVVHEHRLKRFAKWNPEKLEDCFITSDALLREYAAEMGAIHTDFHGAFKIPNVPWERALLELKDESERRRSFNKDWYERFRGEIKRRKRATSRRKKKRSQ